MLRLFQFRIELDGGMSEKVANFFTFTKQSMKITRMKKLVYFFVPAFTIMLGGLAAAQGVEQFIASQTYFNRLQDRQFNLDFRQAGAEFLGMGGASLATAQTPAAALWNPAGLAALSGLELALSGSFNLNTQEVALQQFSGMKVVSEINPRLFPTFAGLHYPLRWGAKSATIGLAYHQPQNFSQTTRDTFYFYPAGTTAEVENPAGRVHAVVPSIAFAFWPHLSLGLSYHYLRGSSEYQFKIQSPFVDEAVFYGFHDEESYAGAFAVFGVQAELKSWLELGATITAPWQYVITEKKEVLLTPRSISGSAVALDTVVTPAGGLQEFKLKFPLSYEMGVALRPSTRLLMAFDFVSRPWSRIDAQTNGTPVNLDLLDGHSIRLGLEYLSQTKWAQFPLRFGYYTNPSPYRDQFFQEQYYGGQIKGGVITLGFGVMRKNWAFHFAFETGEREYSWWLDEGDYYNERISTTRDRFSEITLSLGYQMGSSRTEE